MHYLLQNEKCEFWANGQKVFDLHMASRGIGRVRLLHVFFFHSSASIHILIIRIVIYDRWGRLDGITRPYFSKNLWENEDVCDVNKVRRRRRRTWEGERIVFTIQLIWNEKRIIWALPWTSSPPPSSLPRKSNSINTYRMMSLSRFRSEKKLNFMYIEYLASSYVLFWIMHTTT